MNLSRGSLPAIVVGGAALALAFPKPNLHGLVWVALVPLFVVASRARPWHAWRHGFLFGLVFGAGSLYWVVHAMTVHGGLPAPIAVVGAGFLVAYLAAYWGLFALVIQQTGLRHVAAPVLLAAVWVGLEFLQSWFLSGFPWNLLGYAGGATTLLVQGADLAGVYGLSFLVVTVNATVAAAFGASDARRRQAAVAAGLVVACAAYGGWRLSQATSSTETLRVGLVQGNVPQDLKWDVTARRAILDRHVRLTREAARDGAELVFWPESSWPDPYGIERDAVAHDLVAGAAREEGVGVVVGTVRLEVVDDGYGVANGAVLIAARGAVAGAYEKTHLVPFGEYLPLQSVLRWLGPLVQAVGALRPGDPDQALLGPAAGLPAFGTSICYEIIFPAIARRHVDEGARFLATITNDAWYGTTSGPYQHFAMARLRAVETRRWLVRAANTGISGAVDPWGRVVVATRLEEEAAPTVEIGLRREQSPYVRMGDVFGLVCQLLAIVAVAGALRGRRWLPDAMRPSAGVALSE